MTAHLDLDDPLADLFKAGRSDETDGTEDYNNKARREARVPAFYPALERRYEEGCFKCSGSGQTRWGKCFACQGKGKKVFKTSAADRAKNRATTAARKDRVAAEGFEAFAAANPAEAAWMQSVAPRWELIASFVEGVRKYGSLTEKQMTVVRNGMARDAARDEARTQAKAQAEAVAPVLDTSALEQAFAHAVARSGKLAPTLRIGTLAFTPAKATSANPGALYVKTRAGVYLGKIVKGGRFLCVADCDEATKAQVAGVVADPKAAAVAHGLRTSECSICARALSNPESVARGIGPICAERFGW